MRPCAPFLAAAALAAAPALADPLEGYWVTIPDDYGNRGLVEVAPCGDALCGTLVAAVDAGGVATGAEYEGRYILFDTRALGQGRYRGKVWSPDRDEVYDSRLVLDGDSLSVSGCVLVICRDGGTWQRVTPD